MAQGRVPATCRLTYCRSAVTRSALIGKLVPALKESCARIETSIAAINRA
jgi:hypothetical protein